MKLQFEPAYETQKHVILSTKRFVYFSGGFGSGKTHIGALKLLLNHLVNNCPSVIVAPDYGVLTKATLPELHKVHEKYFSTLREFPISKFHRNGNSLYSYPHIMFNNVPIMCLSAEDPAKITGFQVGAAWVDEACRMKESENPTNDWFVNLNARIRHPDAKLFQMVLTSTPEGSANQVWQRFVADDKTGEYKDIRANADVFYGKTRDNKFLPKETFTQIKATVSEELAQQYLDGIALDYTADRAHPQFSEDNIVDNYQPNFNLPLYVGADFNVAPMCWIAAQVVNDKIYVFDEVYLSDNAQVDKAVYQAVAQGWNKFGLTYFCPDASSHNRKTTGPTEQQVSIQIASKSSWFLNTSKIPTVNPPVDQRINMVCRLLKDGLGNRKLFIDRKCNRLIDNLKNTRRLDNGSYNPGSKQILGHILDALGYACWVIESKSMKPTGAAGFR